MFETILKMIYDFLQYKKGSIAQNLELRKKNNYNNYYLHARLSA